MRGWGSLATSTQNLKGVSTCLSVVCSSARVRSSQRRFAVFSVLKAHVNLVLDEVGENNSRL